MERIYRVWLLLGLFGLGMLACAATWSGGRGPRNANAYPDITFPKLPATVWKAYLGEDYNSSAVSNTIVTDKKVIVAYDKILIAVSVETGEVAWFTQLATTPLDDLLLIDDLIVVSGSTGVIQGISVADGTQAWKKTLPSGVRNGPICAESILYFATRSNTLVKMDAKTGAELAAFPAQGKVEAAPMPMGNSLFICFSDGRLSRLDGTVAKWNYAIPRVTIAYSPVFDGKYLYITAGTSIYCIDPTSRANVVRWTYVCRDMLPGTVTLDGERIYLATRSSKLMAVDTTTGKDVWIKKTADDKDDPGVAIPEAPQAHPQVVGQHLVVRMAKGWIGVFAKETGQLEWRYHLKAPANAKAPAPNKLQVGNIAIDGDDLYFGGNDATIYHLSAKAPDLDPPTFASLYPQTYEQGFIDLATSKFAAAIIEDEGSGLLPETITVRIDRTDRTADLKYEPTTGHYYITLDQTPALGQGLHRVSFTAKDCRGNTGSGGVSFIIGNFTVTQRVPITIAGEFLPKQVKVSPGSAIVWKNTSGATRSLVCNRVFSSDNQFPDGIPNGETWVWIVPANARPGQKYNYSSPGTNITGTIEVNAAVDPNNPNPGGPPGGGPWGGPPLPPI